MTQETSIEAYHYIVNNGLLKNLFLKVYQGVYKYGPCTKLEAVQDFRNNTEGLSSRFTELERMGVLERGPARVCAKSNFKAITWTVTDGLPRKAQEPAKIRPFGFYKSLVYMIKKMEQTNTKSFTIEGLKDLKEKMDKEDDTL